MRLQPPLKKALLNVNNENAHVNMETCSKSDDADIFEIIDDSSTDAIELTDITVN